MLANLGIRSGETRNFVSNMVERTYLHVRSSSDLHACVLQHAQTYTDTKTCNYMFIHTHNGLCLTDPIMHLQCCYPKLHSVYSVCCASQCMLRLTCLFVFWFFVLFLYSIIFIRDRRPHCIQFSRAQVLLLLLTVLRDTSGFATQRIHQGLATS